MEFVSILEQFGNSRRHFISVVKSFVLFCIVNVESQKLHYVLHFNLKE